MLVMALCASAVAAEEDEPAAASGSGYEQYTAANFGFSVALPDHGSLMTPESTGWENEKEVAFEWYGDENDPVSLIQARVDDLGAAIEGDTFKIFCDTLLENWTTDATSYQVETANSIVPIAGNNWNLIEVADSSNKEAKVYYSVFSTYKGSKIYTISFYYLKPVSEEVQSFGKPVLQGFSAS